MSPCDRTRDINDSESLPPPAISRNNVCSHTSSLRTGQTSRAHQKSDANFKTTGNILVTVNAVRLRPRSTPTNSNVTQRASAQRPSWYIELPSIGSQARSSNVVEVSDEEAEERSDGDMSEFATPRESVDRDLSPTASEIPLPGYVHPLPSDARNVVADDHTVIYEVGPDELLEDSGLQVIGETQSELEDGDDDRPIRVLTDFTIYTSDTLRLVDARELFHAAAKPDTFCASGAVKPWAHDDLDSESDSDDLEFAEEFNDDISEAPAQRLKLSSICGLDVHNVAHGHLDMKIYVETKHAWYILDKPSLEYAPLFMDLFIQHRMLHLLVTSASTNPRIQYDEFIKSLAVSAESSDAVALAVDVLGRELTEEDLELESVRDYLSIWVPKLEDEHDVIKLNRVPLVRHLVSTDGLLADLPSLPQPGSSRASLASASRVESNQELEVLKHRNGTVVTPHIQSIASELFHRTLELAGQASSEDPIDDYHVRARKVHLSNPSSIEWGERVGAPGHYRTVKLDGVTYRVGDTVIVEPGEDSDSERAQNALKSKSQRNPLGDKWFAQIIYMFEEDGKPCFHGQWYAHGSKTLLQEITHSRALFPMALCDTIPLASILSKCNLQLLAPGEHEPPEDVTDMDNYFFCNGLIWDEVDTEFWTLADQDKKEALSLCKPFKKCLSCGLIAMDKAKDNLVVHEDLSFSLHGTTYHEDDFIFVCQDGDEDSPFTLAQVTSLSLGKSSGALKVHHRLFLTLKTGVIKASSVWGKFYVIHPAVVPDLKHWLHGHAGQHFYVQDVAHSPSAKSLDDLEPLAIDKFQSCNDCYH
ncbi:hypothetical protein FA95DRAFT_1575568, partial [Auriscalpium vulgare]